jgi:hypothetical protein
VNTKNCTESELIVHQIVDGIDVFERSWLAVKSRNGYSTKSMTRRFNDGRKSIQPLVDWHSFVAHQRVNRTDYRKKSI